ncbi:MAG: glycosyltransferase [Pyrinomonadaceae bacterium]
MTGEKILSGSVVVYKNDLDEINTVSRCFLDGAGPDARLYIIDNSPTEEINEQLIADDRIEYFHNPQNNGYVAHNIAMKKSIDAKFRYHLVLNPDLVFWREVLPTIVKFMDAEHNIGLLIPKVFYTTGELQYLCKLLPTPTDFFARLVLPRSWAAKRMQKFELRVSRYNRVMNVPYISGCFMFLRNSVLRDVGLFDERFFMYSEDIDLSRRINEKYRSVFFPHASIVHRHNAESYRNLRLFKIHFENVFRYFNKYGWFFDKHRRRVNREILAQFDER